jgi:hypothetical protein
MDSASFTSSQLLYLWWVVLRLCAIPLLNMKGNSTLESLPESAIRVERLAYPAKHSLVFFAFKWCAAYFIILVKRPTWPLLYSSNLLY